MSKFSSSILSTEQSSQFKTQVSAKNTFTNQNNSIKKTDKKNQGLFNFINEKLNEWPLWNKMASVFTGGDQSESKLEAAKTPQWMTNNLKVDQLPWNMNQFWGRSLVWPVFQYFHCQDNNMTYFFNTQNVWRNPSKIQHKQIYLPPKKYESVCSMKTFQAKPLLQTYKAELQKKKQQEQ